MENDFAANKAKSQKYFESGFENKEKSTTWSRIYIKKITLQFTLKIAYFHPLETSKILKLRRKSLILNEKTSWNHHVTFFGVTGTIEFSLVVYYLS